jgi:hypothetical protein
VRWFPNLADGTAFWRTVPLDDIDSDGYSDIAIGNLFVSGWDGQTLLTASQFAFAPLTRRIGDMNRDGFVDLGVFADFECKFTDGKTGATETWPTEPLPPDDPTNEQVWLNGFTIGSPGDADGDRVPDFVRIGAALDDELKLIGRIAVVSGRTGVMIWHQDAPENTQEAPRIYGDHDGDGHDDVVFVVEDSLGITQATAYSGVDGSWIGDFTRLFSAGYGEFKGLTPAGDCNGDGKTDFIFALKILSGGGQCVRLMFGP